MSKKPFSGFLENMINRNYILSNSGYKSPNKLQKSDMILDINNDYKAFYKHNTYKYTGKIYRIRIHKHRDPFFCTHNQMFYTCKRKDINPNWVSAEMLNGSHFFGIPINKKSELPKFLDGTKLDDINLWFLMGYFILGGNIDNDKILFEIPNYFSYFKIRYRINIKYYDYNIYECTHNNYNDILSYFQGNIIPFWIENAPIKYIKEFINGYNSSIKNINITENEIHYLIHESIQRLQNKINNNKNFCGFLFNKITNNSSFYFLKNDYAWYQLTSVSNTYVNKTNVCNLLVEGNQFIFLNTLVKGCE